MFFAYHLHNAAVARRMVHRGNYLDDGVEITKLDEAYRDLVGYLP
jgi:hypothetical protein